jgi:hypothetical protein
MIMATADDTTTSKKCVRGIRYQEKLAKLLGIETPGHPLGDLGPVRRGIVAPKQKTQVSMSWPHLNPLRAATGLGRGMIQRHAARYRFLVLRSRGLPVRMTAHFDNCVTDKAATIIDVNSLSRFAHRFSNLVSKALRAKWLVKVCFVIPDRSARLVLIALETQLFPKLAIFVFEFRSRLL